MNESTSSMAGVPSLGKIESLEVDLLLEAIYRRYGYDFRHYARTSLVRRIRNCMVREKLSSISELIPALIHDSYFFDRFLQDMSVTVTSMFRDPQLFKLLRAEVIPKLATYPTINIWHAGCATGEEAYSLAILLSEFGLLERSRIYATDYNSNSLKIAQKGIYSLDKIEEYTKNYQDAGGTQLLDDYYIKDACSLKFSQKLQERIVFAHHNLMKDGSFAQMHIIFCRNVLIYFDKELQNRVLELFSSSLIHRGFLMLGDKENLEFSSVVQLFETHNRQAKIYRKLLPTLRE